MRSWQKRALTGRTALRRARKLIENPEAWTQHMARRTRYLSETGYSYCPGRGLKPMYSYCLTGAIAEVSWPGTKARREATDAIREAVETISSFGVVSYWNDRSGRTHAEVLAALDLAIKLS